MPCAAGTFGETRMARLGARRAGPVALEEGRFGRAKEKEVDSRRMSLQRELRVDFPCKCVRELAR